MIRQFFTSPRKKASSEAGPSRFDNLDDRDVVDLAQLDDDDAVDEWTGEDDQMSPDEGSESDRKAASVLGKRKTSPSPMAETSHLLGPICPICSKALGPATSNNGLNDHIDWCLNKDAISEASKRSPKKAKGVEGGDTAKKKGGGRGMSTRGGMMDWLKKEV